MKNILKILGYFVGVILLVTIGSSRMDISVAHAQQDRISFDPSEDIQSGLDAMGVSDNIPRTFTPGETVTTGTDGQPLEITIKNTGDTIWYDDQSQNGSIWSSMFQLQHTPLSDIDAGYNDDAFTVGNDPATYDQGTVAGSLGAAPCIDPYGIGGGNTAAEILLGDLTGTYGAPDYGDYYLDSTYPYDEAAAYNNYNAIFTSGNGTVGLDGSSGKLNSTLCDTSKYISVQPGDTVEFPLGSLTAPSTIGSYTDEWNMMSSPGALFPYLPSNAWYSKDLANWLNNVPVLTNASDTQDPFGEPYPVTINVVPASATSTITSVTVTAAPSTITTTDTTQCSAVVAGTGAFSQAVTWTATNGTIVQSTGVLTPSGVGVSTCTATSVEDSNKTGSASVTVNPAAALPTVITVESFNSQLQTLPVSASWYFPAQPSGPDPCGQNEILCSNTISSVSTGVAMGTYTICSTLNNLCHPTDSSLYTFNSVKEIPIAARQSTTTNLILSFAKDIFLPVANADPSFPTGTPPVQGLTNSNPSINFIILWDPIADISLNPNPLQLNGITGGSSVTGIVTSTNDGAPGSELTWTAAVNPADASWLSASPLADASQLAAGSSDNITVTADPSNLSVGPHTGTILFTGSSLTNTPIITIYKTLTVTFTVSPAGGPGSGFNCVSNACVAVPSGAAFPDPGGAASCAAACAGGPPPPPPACGAGPCPAPSCTISATPGHVVIPQQATLQYNCSNVTSCQISGGNLAAPIVIGGDASNNVNGTTKVSPTGSAVYTLSCAGPGGNTTVTAPVTVGNSTICESNPGGVSCPKAQ